MKIVMKNPSKTFTKKFMKSVVDAYLLLLIDFHYKSRYRGGAQDDVFCRTGNRIEGQCSLLDGASVA